MKLRSYQVEIVKKGVNFMTSSKKVKPSIIVAPTAAGKSIIIASIAKETKEKIITLQPNKELLQQNYDKFTLLGGEASIYSASFGKKEIGHVTYATIGSIYKTPEIFLEAGIKKIIIDECHLYPRESSGMLNTFISALKATHVLGLTATPLKLQNNMDSYGSSYSKLVMLTNRSKKGTFFKDIIHVTQISELVDNGYWTKLTYQAYDFKTGDLVYNSSKSDYTEKSMEIAYKNNNIGMKIISKIDELRDRKHILVAVPSIAEAEDLAKKISNAACVSSLTPKKERDEIISNFRNGSIRAVIQVNVLSVGFDYPELDCLVCGRPTASISWWYQFVGRGTRTHDEKKDCLIVDFSGNFSTFGKVEDLHYDKEYDSWELYGKDLIKISGVPIHEIGLYHKKKEGEYVLDFGKFRGTPLKETPQDYRDWMLKTFDFAGDKGKVLKKELELLKK